MVNFLSLISLVASNMSQQHKNHAKTFWNTDEKTNSDYHINYKVKSRLKNYPVFFYEFTYIEIWVWLKIDGGESPYSLLVVWLIMLERRWIFPYPSHCVGRYSEFRLCASFKAMVVSAYLLRIFFEQRKCLRLFWAKIYFWERFNRHLNVVNFHFLM